MRHAGVLSALLLTAALMCAMPGIARMPANPRVNDSLRPPTLRTITVWLMPGDVGDRALINELCAAYEKQNRGARVFLRVVTADELYAENAVLPDVALFQTGEISQPQQVFLPLGDEFVREGSGVYAGVCRAVPVWLAPNVLSIPQEWLASAAPHAPRQQSLLAAATAEPAAEESGVLDDSHLPWAQLIRPGALETPEGAGWQQMLAACPADLQESFRNALLGSKVETPASATSADEWCTTLPKSLGASPTPMPPLTASARVETLASHRRRVQQGEALKAYVPGLAVSTRVRYAAICRDGEDARTFVQLLMDSAAAAAPHGLVSPGAADGWTDALSLALAERYSSVCMLPNAFAHTQQELKTLCADGFARLEEPVGTLLRLR